MTETINRDAQKTVSIESHPNHEVIYEERKSGWVFRKARVIEGYDLFRAMIDKTIIYYRELTS